MQIGKGSLNQLPEIIKTLEPIKSFLIVTDKQMVEFGYVKRLQDILNTAGLCKKSQNLYINKYF